MKQRWVVVGILALALFAVNGIARLIVWLAGIADDQDQILAGLVSSAVAGLLAVAAGIRWGYLYPMPRVAGDLAVAIVAGALLAVLVGPFFAGSTPLVEGVGFAFRQFLFVAGVLGFGAVLGVLLCMTAGKDWKSRGWKAHEERYRSRPKRV